MAIAPKTVGSESHALIRPPALGEPGKVEIARLTTSLLAGYRVFS